MAAPVPVHFVLPGGIDDPAAPSGGNVYDRRVCQGLTAAGWPVRETALPGAWPQPDAADRTRLARTLAALPDDSLVVLDGLVACGVPDAVLPQSGRLRLAVLVHLPLADETGLPPATAARLDDRERRTLRAADAVVATSPWTARRLAAHHGLDPRRVHLAAPGAAPAPLAPGTDGAARLLCVASLTPRKGHDLLIEALSGLTGLSWDCEFAGAPGPDPGYVAELRETVARRGLTRRVRLLGPRTGAALHRTYAAADLVVLASRAETYGMVVTEALARGTPVLATDVGGVPDALGRAPDGSLPGVLVPPGDPGALAAALRRWLEDAALRHRLRMSARRRRDMLAGWQTTTQSLAGVLEQLRRQPGRTA
ncbi:glycosyltransferase family 4 protein [Streptomyces sp. NBRC 110611]|uniref:glycosyltransferase family 4 protein n=1 Tax=Streptomyces sp. NBRC 110611 TaxID=1621259 RepID=UPI0009A02017|nr:glycosyltransferase family 4 protein [Streptomyces sp. NBRC 110611]